MANRTGTGNNDSLTGTNARDTLLGAGGNDILDALLGNDSLQGDTGNDVLYGGDGNDTLWGMAGSDTLYGGAGDDFLSASMGTPVDGDNITFGGAGNDTIYIEYGESDAYGGAGDDIFRIEFDGTDTLTGGTGADLFQFTNGNNRPNGETLPPTVAIMDFNAADGDTIRLRDFGGLGDFGPIEFLGELTTAPNFSSQNTLVWYKTFANHTELYVDVHGDGIDSTISLLGSQSLNVSNNSFQDIFSTSATFTNDVTSRGSIYTDFALLAKSAGSPSTATELGWTAVSNAALGLTFGETTADGLAWDYSNGLYSARNLVATSPNVVFGAEANVLVLEGLYQGKKTLSLSFRGTDNPDDAQDYLDTERHYEKYHVILTAVEQLVATGDYESIFIAGHSLGGAMAQRFLFEYGDQYIANGIEIKTVTFGSPGSEADDLSGDPFRFDIVDFVERADPVSSVPYRTFLGDQDQFELGSDFSSLDDKIRVGRKVEFSKFSEYFNADDVIPILGGGAIISLSRLLGIGPDYFEPHLMDSYLNSALTLPPDFDPYLENSDNAAPVVASIDGLGWGFSAADSLTGSEFDDWFICNAGNDTVVGGGGDDAAWGQDDDDVLYGGAGNDTLRGNIGADQVNGDDGEDDLKGQLGNDSLFGGDGSDTLVGGGNDDRVEGGAGNDTAAGSSGRDQVHGGAGNDAVRGQGGPDALFGGGGDDTLVGHQGFDTLYGGEGNDLLIGAQANDELTGGNGADSFVFVDDSGRDTVTDFKDGTDKLVMSGVSGFGALDIVDTPDGAEISFGTTTVLVAGVTAANLTASDFVFS